MKDMIQALLYLHIAVGLISLLTGLIALTAAKGQTMHRRAGRVYFYAMTIVFITGLLIAGYRDNHFLFLIAFLSYYSVFCGVRALKLKQLHQSQTPKWYDWFAGILNAMANVFFVCFGLYYGITNSFLSGGALLSIGFGLGGLYLSYTNLKPFVYKPEKAYHWYLSHIGNMTGGYIATVTAFFSTLVTRYDLMNPFVAFALPSIIGVPLLIYWQKRTEKRFQS